MTLSQDNHNLI